RRWTESRPRWRAHRTRRRLRARRFAPEGGCPPARVFRPPVRRVLRPRAASLPSPQLEPAELRPRRSSRWGGAAAILCATHRRLNGECRGDQGGIAFRLVVVRRTGKELVSKPPRHITTPQSFPSHLLP